VSDCKKSFAGRLLVASLFVTVMLYFGVAVIGSIVVDLYGRPPPAEGTSMTVKERTWCIRNLVGLRDELEGEVTFQLQRARTKAEPMARWNDWDAEWQRTLAAARGRCVNAGNLVLNQAYDRLMSLHVGYAAAVSAAIDARASAALRFDESLQQLRDQP
jgi:hypothetical protein